MGKKGVFGKDAIALRIHAKSLSDALAPSKKKAGVPIVCQIFATKAGLVPLIEGLCSSNPWKFELSGFGRNGADDLWINDSPLL